MSKKQPKPTLEQRVDQLERQLVGLSNDVVEFQEGLSSTIEQRLNRIENRLQGTVPNPPQDNDEDADNADKKDRDESLAIYGIYCEVKKDLKMNGPRKYLAGFSDDEDEMEHWVTDQRKARAFTESQIDHMFKMKNVRTPDGYGPILTCVIPRDIREGTDAKENDPEDPWVIVCGTRTGIPEYYLSWGDGGDGWIKDLADATHFEGEKALTVLASINILTPLPNDVEGDERVFVYPMRLSAVRDRLEKEEDEQEDVGRGEKSYYFVCHTDKPGGPGTLYLTESEENDGSSPYAWNPDKQQAWLMSAGKALALMNKQLKIPKWYGSCRVRQTE